MGNPPRVTLNGSQSAQDQWPPIPLLRCTALALHSTVYLNTCRHPRGGEIAPDPLKLISSQARERGNCLMKMDHGDGFTFHFLTAGIQLYYSQSSPLCSPSQTRHSGGSVYSLQFGFCAFFWEVRVCVHVCGVCWLPECKNLPALQNLLSWPVNREMLTIQPSSIWPHSSWSSCSVRSPVK